MSGQDGLNNVLTLLDIVYIVELYSSKFLKTFDDMSDITRKKTIQDLNNLNLSIVQSDTNTTTNTDWIKNLHNTDSIVVNQLKYYEILAENNKEDMKKFNNSINYYVLKSILGVLKPLDLVKLYNSIAKHRYNWSEQCNQILQENINNLSINNSGYSLLNKKSPDINTSVILFEDQKCYKNFMCFYENVIITQYMKQPTGSKLQIIVPPVLHNGVTVNKHNNKRLFYVVIPASIDMTEDYPGYNSWVGDTKENLRNLGFCDVEFKNFCIMDTKMKVNSRNNMDNIPSYSSLPSSMIINIDENNHSRYNRICKECDLLNVRAIDF